MKKVGIIGVGLMGGSFALALQKTGFSKTIIGIDSSEENLEKALDLGVITQKASMEDVPDLDFIVLATPVDIICKELPNILDLMHPNATITDLGSAKSEICEAVKNHAKRHRFVAAHPIAGTEFSGPESAFASLFLNKIAIICEPEKSAEDALEMVRTVYQNFWCEITEMNPEEHDLHTAYVSHLSHIISFALGKTVIEKEKDHAAITHLAGSGFASTVRLAKSSPQMWNPIFRQNKKFLVEAIDVFQNQLENLKNAISTEEILEIDKFLKEANQIGKVLNK